MWKRSPKRFLWFRQLSVTGPPSLWLQWWAGTAMSCLCFHSTWHWLCTFWNIKLVVVWGRGVSNLMIISYGQLEDREMEVQMGRYRQGVTETIKGLSKYLERATGGIKVRNNSESCCLLQRSCRILPKYLPLEFEIVLLSCWKCAGSEKEINLVTDYEVRKSLFMIAFGSEDCLQLLPFLLSSLLLEFYDKKLLGVPCSKPHN